MTKSDLKKFSKSLFENSQTIANTGKIVYDIRKKWLKYSG